MTRSYESNGPDVKIRGNAHHVAEKYLQLARDAHTGGDPVAAENYLQHAEHYFRLIASAQVAQALAQSGQPRSPGEGESDDMEDDGDFGTLSDRFASPSERQNAYQQPQQGFQPQPNVTPGPPQPYSDRPSYEGDRQGQNDRAGFANRQDRQGSRFPERGPRQDRPFVERNEAYRDNRQGRDGRPRDFRPYRDSQSQPARDVSAEGAAQPGLPSFITASPRPSAADPAGGTPLPDEIASSAPVEAPKAAPPEFESPTAEGAFSSRGRRRRLRSPYGFGGGSPGESSGADNTPEITDDSPVRE